MTLESLQIKCRDYFDRAQDCWNAYFSKWETMAKDEKINDEDVDGIGDAEAESNPKKRIISAARKLRNKSIGMLNKKSEVQSRRKAKPSKKKVQSKISKGKVGETEIIHTAENQTNLECEVVNNKHFEADLKAIFIEIMSENTNKMGMFSVLSRMFSGNGDTISNFSLGSMTVEKNEFSISPVSKTILHCARHNEFLNWNFPPCRPNGCGRECVSASLQGSQPSDTSECEAADDYRILRGEGRVPRPRFGSFSNQFGTMGRLKWPSETRIRNCQAIAYCDDKVDTQGSENKLFSERYSQTADEAAVSSGHGLSPQAVLQRIMKSPAPAIPSNDHVRKCYSENKPRRKRTKKDRRQSAISDDDSDDQSESTFRSLKIFCTPTRPIRRNKQEESDSQTASKDSDNEDCFNIIDRD